MQVVEEFRVGFVTLLLRESELCDNEVDRQERVQVVEGSPIYRAVAVVVLHPLLDLA